MDHKRNFIYPTLLIFVCFTLVSAGYLSWLYHLMEIPSLSPASDMISEVFGYLCQAAGMGIFAIIVRYREDFFNRIGFLLSNVFYIVLLIPAILSDQMFIVLIFGFLMNLLCGIIFGFYLYHLAKYTPKRQLATAFGAAYGGSTIVLWMLSLPGDFLRSGYALIFYAVLSILSVIIFNRSLVLCTGNEENSSGNQDTSYIGLIVLAFVMVILLSVVKNLGFVFPSADIHQGISLELSRVFYGISLVFAGIISDKNRKYGAVLCLASLVVPFISLVLSGETAAGLLLWCLNYFFFGFFSVFRVILFQDIAQKRSLLYLSGLGLLAGRTGDAAGTLIYITLGGEASYLVIIASTLFVLTVFLFFQVYQQLYHLSSVPVPEETKQDEQEKFEMFCVTYQCSRRERDILRALLKEQSNSEIAGSLIISESTVKFHIHNLLKKTGCKNRIELLALYHLKD